MGAPKDFFNPPHHARARQHDQTAVAKALALVVYSPGANAALDVTLTGAFVELV
jgi:hypothetical protein